MRIRRTRSYSSYEIELLALIGLVSLIIVFMLSGVNIGLSHLLHGGGGFYAPWEAARGFLFAHADPYGATIANETQRLAYGRPATPTENPYFLTIPFFILPVYFPLALIADPDLARGLWLLINEAALVGMAYLSFKLIEFYPPRLFFVLYSLLSVFVFYTFDSLLEGTTTVLLALLFLALLFCLITRRDELAGVLLVFTIFNWEVTLLFLLLVFWKVISEKRWRVISGFGMALIVLLILSFLLYPGWVFGSIIASLKMLRSDFATSSFMVFAHLWPEFGIRIGQTVSGLILVLLGYEWAASRSSEFRRFVWAACLTLAATPMIGLRTNMGDLVLLFPSLSLIFAATISRWKSGYWITGLLYLIVLVVPWGLYSHFFLSHDQPFLDYLFLFYPLFSIGGLYWIRWWVMRPPLPRVEEIR